jgi:hypothetical protein
MIPIYQQKLVQIEVTNACINQCANCTRFVGHHLKPYFMDLDTVRKAIDSLEGFPGHIGLMGGEPTLHPQFKEICKIFQEMIPDRTRRELWTAGYKWDEYRDLIMETFDKERISFNDHSTDDGKHSPMLCAVKDLVKDKNIQKKLIDNCWVQPRWSASITPYGCYFCEIAEALDILFKGKNGWPIEKGWWNKTPEQFQDQVNAICYNCGAMIPLGETSDHATYDLVSKSNLKRLKELKSPKVLCGNYATYNKKWTEKEIEEKKENWKPYNWRSFYAHEPDDYKNKTIIK